jgi:nucleoside 2-deoxyribosyltransferase
MRFYLAGPIDFEADKGSGWRDELKGLVDTKIKDVHTREIVLFDPVAPYCFSRVSPDMSAYIHDVNLVALEQASAVVARLMKGQISIGTPIELYVAARMGKPIILITDMDESVYMTYVSRGAVRAANVREAFIEMIKLCEASEMGIMPISLKFVGENKDAAPEDQD